MNWNIPNILTLMRLIAAPAVAIMFLYFTRPLGLLRVTKVAKWKTTVQMFAISVLFAKGAFEHYLIERSVGMDDATFEAIMNGAADDPMGLYFRKAIPYLKDVQ